jgi:Na+/H+-dicarboxylate symporter
MKTEQGKTRMSLSTQVLIGLVAGLVLGVFFGELVGFLNIAGKAFILLLQMTVLPYIVVSLIGGLGRLSFSDARSLAVGAGLILLTLWGIVLAIIVLMPFAFPEWVSASFFSTSLIEVPEPFDFLGLYIPANPFHSLANTIVPAVVLFSAAVGIALIGIKNKKALIDLLDILSDIFMRITQFVAGLAPYGVFALAASAAGTMDVEELGRLQVYLITYAAIAILLSFWVLPGLVMSLTPVRYRSVVGQTRDALITAFATGNLLIVLPMLADKSKALVQEGMKESEDFSSAVDVLVPVSFNFPNLGKLLSLSFIPFAAWYIDMSIPAGQYPNFLISGLASFFGEVVVAMPFLLNLLHIPSDMFQLFITIDVLTGRFGTLLAAMHTVVVAIIGTFAMTGRIVIRWRKLLRFGIVTVALTILCIVSVRLFFNIALDPKYTKYKSFIEMTLMYDPVQVKVHDSLPSAPSDEEKSALERIRKRGSMRVGYTRDGLPFAFVNASSNLVGFDVEMMHQLARELGVKLEFVLIDRKNIAESLNKGVCDIVVSTAITTEKSGKVAFPFPHMDQTLAFIVKDHRREQFKSWKTVQEMKGLRIGIPDTPYYISLVHRLLPHAEIVPLSTARVFFKDKGEELDAFVFSAESGSAWTLIYPDYSVVVPLPDPIAVPVAYAVARGDHDMLEFLNIWLGLKKRDGTIKKINDHWILGKGAGKQEPRWSVVRDVLHWVK